MSENPTPTTDRPRQHKIGGDTGDPAMYAKVSPEIRRDLDEAIVNHKPATYRGIYEKFRLVERGVSFWSFYRYAVNVRSQAEKLHFDELVLPDEAHLRDTLPKLIAQRLLETLLYDEELSPKEVLRLTTAYRAASLTAIARDKAAAPNRARAEARDTAANRARAEARDNTDGSDASPASGEADDNLHLLENYITALERETKARQQAAQAEIQAIEQTVASLSPAPAPLVRESLVRESLLAPPSGGIPSHVPSAPVDLVPHSSPVPRSAFPVPRSSDVAPAAAYVEELLRQPHMRELGLPATAAEFAEAIRHLAPGIADAISPTHAPARSPVPPDTLDPDVDPVEVEHERPDRPGVQRDAELLVPCSAFPLPRSSLTAPPSTAAAPTASAARPPRRPIAANRGSTRAPA